MTMKSWVLAVCLLVLPWAVAANERITIAAASDLRFALNDIVDQYRQWNPRANIQVIYGSSGKMTTQIMHGAPYDIFFSADIAFPQQLAAAGFTATTPEIYGIGRIVLWSARHEVSDWTLQDLLNENVRRIAIAQPTHAPYGMRAKEALQSQDLWAQLEHKMVYGENIAQAAQMAQSGAADVAIIALALAKGSQLSARDYKLIDANLHAPLTQGYVITQRAKENFLAHDFAAFMQSDIARNIMEEYGFALPTADCLEANSLCLD
ncbi:molybdate ABC transporter substrate-binding protein [Aliidiomarina halalkaliphila]|uniref:Molybdate ABC transporter substrate-binding protein n=2 Tax=Aliidiomarina halalkaliphila TaxID=2593535 RepID=A0A552X6B4_9GAMM|nr:molybdate ABC transporter substrate-binding protein [Aliidiomarina halalkaliphila]